MSSVTEPPVFAETARLQALFDQHLDQHLGLRRGSFASRARAASRHLPRPLRADLAQVVAATRLMGPPKLFRQIDAAALSAASNRVAAHLKTIDRADRRRGLWLGILGAIMANILILTALLIALLRWRGLV
ncbi:hypothetical protein [Salipiger marinus]|uniref:Uncharacterized protein n=1 Tax=Salipiger marinus TaxID=555512 RepID=A0A1G8JSH8_9RHOB|nr:hypothetical protein [Salipiger marinus]SDI34184.1 hypothetical protein SAMN04487993_1003235 [Salipiger marinus]